MKEIKTKKVRCWKCGFPVFPIIIKFRRGSPSGRKPYPSLSKEQIQTPDCEKISHSGSRYRKFYKKLARMYKRRYKIKPNKRKVYKINKSNRKFGVKKIGRCPRCGARLTWYEVNNEKR